MGGWCWDEVRSRLDQAGLSSDAIDLPGHGPSGLDVSVTLEDYATAVADRMRACTRPTVAVAHSFGGVVLSQATEWAPDAVASQIYVGAFLLACGESFNDAAGTIVGSRALDNLTLQQDGALVSIAPAAAHDAVAHDLSPDAFSALAERFIPEPTAPLATPLQISTERRGRVPRAYVETLEDRALPLKTQRAMQVKAGVESRHGLLSGHLPMFSVPDELARIVVEVAKSSGDRPALTVR